jgi:Zn-dependent M28 family amino/carboxypeptidase
MKSISTDLRMVILMICLSLVLPIQLLETTATAQTKSNARRTKGKGKTTGRRGRNRRKVDNVKRPSFDNIISANRAMLTEAGDIESAGAKIEESVLRAHVKFLADDLLEGRGPGSRGGMLAAKYIAAEFESLNLEPASADRSYFQQVQMIGTKTDPSTSLVVKSSAGEGGKSSEQIAEFKFGDEFVCGTDLEQNEIPIFGEIVFVGYGIQSPENRWDDFKGVDLRGKVLMIMVNDPPASSSEPNLFGGRGLTYYGRWTYKYEQAARLGAAGVILIHTNESAGYGWSVVRNSWSGERFGLLPDGKSPALRLKSWVTDEVAQKIVQMGGHNLNQLRQTAASRNFRPVILNARVEMVLRTQVQRMTSPNVVAIYGGIDPTLKNEYLIYSAHWDHLGMRPDQTGDNIYNGAADNATGIAGLLAIAKAYTSLGIKPKRSILFIATTAEEQGLLGAEYYIKNPLVPIAQTAANINVDLMNVHGVTTDITPMGAERSTIGSTIEEVAKENQLIVSPDAHPEQGYFYRSDHFPFAKAGIPAVNFEPGTKFVGHSNKWADEQIQDYRRNRYHQPSDEYSPNWNFSGMVQQSRLAFQLGLRLANSNEMPQWNKGDEFESARLKTLGRVQ